MKEAELIKVCRYYNREPQNPFDIGYTAAFWNLEQTWVDMMLAESDQLVRCWDEYAADGLADFEHHDGVPSLLKAVLYNRFQYWMEGTASDFKSFYRHQYMGNT